MADADQVETTDALLEMPPVRDEEGRVSHDFLALVRAAIETENAAALIGLAGDLHEADVADLIESLPEDEWVPFVRLLGEEFGYVAALLVIGLFGYICWRGLRAASDANPGYFIWVKI